jgi:protein-tyrosine-phosphatase
MNRWLRVSLSVLAAGVFFGAGPAAQSNVEADRARIVFVCEHGAAKSVIAAAYFNTLAAERGLTERATFRGVSPQPELSVAALRGLREDGLTLPTANPSVITSDDVNGATHIFAT